MANQRLSLEQRQSQLDASDYGGRVRKKFWSEPDITGLTVVVIGQRYPDAGGVELALRIHVHGQGPIAQRQGTMASADGKSRFTFFQTANSVFTNSHSVIADASYSGMDPPTEP